MTSRTLTCLFAWSLLFGSLLLPASAGLNIPASGSRIRGTVQVSFDLPEDAFPNTVRLTWNGFGGPTIMSLGSSMESSGLHAFSFQPTNPAGTAGGAIVSSSGPNASGSLPDGAYSVVLSYKDRFLEEHSFSSTRVLLDNATSPVLTFSAGDAAAGSTLVKVEFSLPEPAADGSLSLVWVKGGVTIIMTLADSVGISEGSKSITFDPLRPIPSSDGAIVRVETIDSGLSTRGGVLTDGVYAFSLRYGDALGNLTAQTSSIDVAVDSHGPELTLPSLSPVEATSPTGAVVSFTIGATDQAGVASVTTVPASGDSFSLGTTAVQVTATDNHGRTATGDFSITVQDTIRPDASVPPAIFVESSTTGAGTPIGDLTGQVSRSDAVGVFSVTQSLNAAATLPLGVFPLSFTILDAAGNGTSVSTNLIIGFTRPLQASAFIAAETGEPAPNSGEPTLPPEAVISGFGTPSLNDYRTLAARATLRAGRRTLNAVYLQDGSGLGSLSAFQGKPAPTLDPLAAFKSFGDPIQSTHELAFLAKMQGPEIKSGNDDILWGTFFTGQLRPLLREGAEVPGLPGCRLKSVTSVAVQGRKLLVLVKLIRAPKLVTAADDTALVLLTGLNAGTPLLRTGTEMPGVPGVKIKSFSTLQPAAGSPDQPRWQDDYSTLAKVSFGDGSIRVVRLIRFSPPQILLSTTDPATPIAATAKWKTFGLPATAVESSGPLATVAKLVRQRGTITARNETALLYRASSQDWTMLAQADGAAPSESGHSWSYATFGDPAVNTAGQTAFLAKLRGPGLTNANRTALIAGLPGGLILRARLGGFAPNSAGVPSAARWRRFLSFGLGEKATAGPILLGEVVDAEAPPDQKVRLCATDSAGTWREVLRTGVPLISGKPKLTSMKLLGPTSAAYAAGRSFNSSGSVALLATFADQSQALLRIDLP